MKICIVGLGYIGLPTAVVLAENGMQVHGYDTNAEVVDSVSSGVAHLIEPGLEELLKKHTVADNITASLDIRSADIFIIAVPTPVKLHDDGSKAPDIEFVRQAFHAISSVLKPGDLIILESTSPVGTTEKMSEVLSEIRSDLILPHQQAETANIHIAYCPERVIPGRTMIEIINNDRVIGGIDCKSAERAANFYQTFVEGKCYTTTARTAELVKLTENSCRDVQIAFANELAKICDEANVNVFELIDLANKHPRINILSPGPGVGGHCIAVDPWFIIHEHPETSKMIKLARVINEARPKEICEKVISTIDQKNIKSIALYGLSFKANIDDVRNSPAIQVANLIRNEAEADVSIYVVEPNLSILPNSIDDGIILTDIEYAYENVGMHVLLVEHDEFTALNMSQKLFIDTKGVWRR